VTALYAAPMQPQLSLLSRGTAVLDQVKSSSNPCAKQKNGQPATRISRNFINQANSSNQALSE
jgi:hypothetical protein